MSADLVLSGRYRLLERLATGGMGEVWRAVDESLGRDVAVKLLRLEFDDDASAQARFESEARLAAGLHHGGIAQVYDFGAQDGRTFLVMELVPGEPLDEIIGRDGGLPVEAVLDLLVQAARALAVPHAAGIVHRDVKPANLMVSPDGAVKITDFGIARRLAAAAQTQTGMVMGTAHYISPEQASGKEVSPSADLYSLGVVAYECLTGRPPFEGRGPVQIAMKHVRDAAPELPAHVPAAVRELVAALLAKSPADRPQDASEVADLALRIRADLAARPVPEPAAPDVGTTVVSPRFDGDESPDSLTNKTVTGQRRAALVSASAAVGVLAAVLAGALLAGSAPAESGPVRPDPSGAPATSPVGDGADDPPAETSGTPIAPVTGRSGPAAVPRRRPTDTPAPAASSPSTPASPGVSPSRKPTGKPTRVTPSAPQPTPTPVETTTTPSTPSPDPSPDQNGEIGSEDMGGDVRGKVHI
ncbi:serine/threonine-protein kinase [Spirillospora albida]|uniref:serine/threonine-protein kinase n=1 Tax=Spirillospora albida TaxID=58123 RepID=UPI00068B56BE|nr:serine/threonine-protein kinase [Spirillospora albida]